LLRILGAWLLLSSCGALAQTYPVRPIRVIVPYAAGQATDVMCRVFVEQLKLVLNQSIVVENRVGAASNLGSGEAARAVPDGYTLLCTGNAVHVANPLIYSSMGFDPDQDLVPISGIAATGYVLAVAEHSKYRNVGDLVAAAKVAASPLNTGLSSTTARVIYGLFREAAKINLASIPYTNGNQSLFPDLVRGDTDLVIEAMPGAMGQVLGGAVRPLAVTLPERSPLLPGVATLREAGFDVVLVGWNGFYAPKGTPADIISKLNAASRAALGQPEVAKRLAAIACVPMPTSPEQLTTYIREDRAKWKPMVELYKLKVD
jgi:tripartite-type tricarboxylate transporter receptor subunit TctC